MDEWKKDARRDVVFVDIDALVPKDHLLRKIEKIMDYDWLYERLDPYYCHDNGRPGRDPVVLIKMVLIQHLYGIPSLRQTYQRIQDTLSYRWFLGYGLLDTIPHFATVSYAFCKRFPTELTEEIFAHILNKALNNRMLDPTMIFMDGTHIKASANKKKHQKEKVTKAAKIYAEQLREEVNAEREKLGKKPIEEEDLDLVEQLRRTDRGKEIYAMRKETIERVFADAKEKHAMRYTHHRGLARVTNRVRLKYAAMNLKKLAEWSWNNSIFHHVFALFYPVYAKTPVFAS